MRRKQKRSLSALAGTALSVIAAANPVSAQQSEPDRVAFGTGFVAFDGVIVTAAHGLKSCRSVTLTQNQTSAVSANDIQIEKSLDLALIRAKLPVPVQPLPLRTDPAPRLGEPVYLLGYSLQRPLLPGHPSFYATVVSGIGGLRGDPQTFRLQAVVLPGMSGAPVLDASGQVIGVVKTHLIETRQQGGPTLGGQSFAILGSNIEKLSNSRTAPPAGNGAKAMTSTDIAARALASTVLITCNKGEMK